MAGRHWREAATLMLVCQAAKPKVSRPLDSDFRVLFLKRSQRSSFMPNAFVFPGGVIEPSDFAEAWVHVFEKYGHSQSEFLKKFRTSAPLPELYRSKLQNPILPEVGFRISAIREMFEESGILLASHLPNNCLSQDDIKHWRKIVHDDPAQFLTFFHEVGGYPAVWDLHEWISWLTPAFSADRHRFNTAFYITFVEEMPSVVLDEKEVVDVQIASPWDILEQSHKGSLLLPTPQAYEMSRIISFRTYDDLHSFARERGKKGMDHYYPVLVKAANGIISVLPGDDLYPVQPDYEGKNEEQRSKAATIEQLRESATNMNRVEIHSLSDRPCIVNIELKYGHVKPINYVEFFTSSKL